MKRVILLFFHTFCGLFLSVASDLSLFRNFPAGPYRLEFKAITRCDLPTNGKIRINWYLSKNAANQTQMKGSFSPQVPIDDSLDLIFNMAIKDSTGGWMNNALNYESPKACSTIKSFLGTPFNQIMESIGIKHFNCPLSPGTYIATGLDTDLYMESNLPKTFVYGTYKIRYGYSKNNELYGCYIAIVELKRP